jgi:protein NrfD
MTEITNTRANELVEPFVHVWHGEIALYLFLGGIVAGIMILTGVLRIWKPDKSPSLALQLVPWASLVLLSVGMLCLAVDLANPFNAWRFYLTLNPVSPMSWGSWILLLVYPVATHFAWANTSVDIREAILKYVPFMRGLSDWSIRSERFFGKLSIVAGSLLGIYTGILLGAFSSRPFWNSALLGPLFLVSGLSTAAAFILMFSLKDEEREWFSLADMLLIVSELGIIVLWMIALGTGGESYNQAISLITGGPWTTAFWVLVVALGLITPLFGEWIERRQGHIPGRAAPFLVLVGGFSLRWIMVYAGQYSHWVDTTLAQISR